MDYFTARRNRYRTVTDYLVYMANTFTNMGFDVYYHEDGTLLTSITIVNFESHTTTSITFSEVPYRWYIPNQTIIVNGMVQVGGQNYMKFPFTAEQVLESFHPMHGSRYKERNEIRTTEQFLKENHYLKPWKDCKIEFQTNNTEYHV